MKTTDTRKILGDKGGSISGKYLRYAKVTTETGNAFRKGFVTLEST